MKLIIKVFALFNLSLVIFLFVVGTTSTGETYIRDAVIVNSTPAIVWHHATDTETLSKWIKNLYTVKTEGTQPLSSGTKVSFWAANSPDAISFKVKELQQEKRIVLENISNRNPLIRNMKISAELKSLLDGTTEISWQISYNTVSFSSRIFDQLVFRKNLQNDCESSLITLKRTIERF